MTDEEFAENLLNEERVAVVPGNAYVTAASFAAPYTTAPSVQRGVDASSAGNTVHVGPGTYAENVVTTVPLTVEGVGSTTIIAAPPRAPKGDSSLTRSSWMSRRGTA